MTMPGKMLKKDLYLLELYQRKCIWGKSTLPTLHKIMQEAAKIETHSRRRLTRLTSMDDDVNPSKIFYHKGLTD